MKSAIHMSLPFARRTFLKAVGAGVPTAFGSRAILRAQTIPSSSQRKEFNMEIKRAGSQPSSKGPADWFTGTVRIDPLFQEPDPALVQGASVTERPQSVERPRGESHSRPAKPLRASTHARRASTCGGRDLPCQAKAFPPRRAKLAPGSAQSRLARSEGPSRRFVRRCCTRSGPR